MSLGSACLQKTLWYGNRICFLLDCCISLSVNCGYLEPFFNWRSVFHWCVIGHRVYKLLYKLSSEKSNTFREKSSLQQQRPLHQNSWWLYPWCWLKPCLRHVIELRCLAVDDSCCRNLQLLQSTNYWLICTQIYLSQNLNCCDCLQSLNMLANLCKPRRLPCKRSESICTARVWLTILPCFARHSLAIPCLQAPEPETMPRRILMPMVKGLRRWAALSTRQIASEAGLQVPHTLGRKPAAANRPCNPNVVVVYSREGKIRRMKPNPRALPLGSIQ